jgi:hypothetical protein
VTAEFSKSQIDRLGERLREGQHSDSDLESLDASRSSFGEAQETVIATLRELDLDPGLTPFPWPVNLGLKPSDWRCNPSLPCAWSRRRGSPRRTVGNRSPKPECRSRPSPSACCPLDPPSRSRWRREASKGSSNTPGPDFHRHRTRRGSRPRHWSTAYTHSASSSASSESSCLTSRIRSLGSVPRLRASRNGGNISHI